MKKELAGKMKENDDETISKAPTSPNECQWVADFNNSAVVAWNK